MRNQTQLLPTRLNRVALPRELTGEPLRERLQRPHHAGTQYNHHDALLSERRIGKASAEPAGDYADICSAGTAATSGNVRKVGITQVSE